MKLKDKINTVSGVGEQTAKLLSLLGVNTIEDLLFHLPFRIEDRSKLMTIAKAKYNDPCVVEGEILNVHSRKTRKGSLMVEARIKDSSGQIGAIWFNQRFVLSQLKTGQKVMLFGTKKLAPTIGNPFIVKKIITNPEYVPVYRSTKGLHQGIISRVVKKILPACEQVNDALPAEIAKKYRLPRRRDALLAVHQPANTTELESAKKLFGFEELLGLAVAVELSKRHRQEIKTDLIILDTDYLKRFTSSLPFTLTNGQRQAAWRIIQNMTNGYPSNQLLYGEVGSGKTAVSLIAAIATIRAGKRVLILVPTVTLASQQTGVIQQIVGSGITVGQITSSVKQGQNADIVVGTHALLNKASELDNIGLIIIDEQQRFGVRQRQELSTHHPNAHLLMTTATPIPRSLAQTILGNLTITYLMDKPAHQQEVTTKRFDFDQRQSVLAEVRRRLATGEAGYVICPAIEEAEQSTFFEEDEKKSVNVEQKKLAKELPGVALAALHGKMRPEEKTEILHRFLDGSLHVLVATTVVEVGIDNPNATWMVIENAEMFGLSTLHQLRGRVGRGKKASVCFVAQTSSDEKSSQRLAMFEQSRDGLALAEADLALRGPGEILGNEQSGLPSLRYANLSDSKIVKEVFALAQKIVNDGIDKYPTIKPLIKEVDGLAAS